MILYENNDKDYIEVDYEKNNKKNKNLIVYENFHHNILFFWSI